MNACTKKIAQTIIRNIHCRYFLRDLPNQICIYFHSLEKEYYEEFREMVKYFKVLGYCFTNPSDFFNMDFGKRIFISFDDNFRSWYHALRLFDETGIKVTFYVNSLAVRDHANLAIINEYFDRIKHFSERTPLSSTEIRELFNAGHCIGSHTHSHFMLSMLSEKNAMEEIYRGKEELQSILGCFVEHFSYPFGMRRHFRESLREYCKKIGITTIASAIPGMQYKKQTKFMIYRAQWYLDKSLSWNIENIRINGSLFERLTGCSATL